MMATIRVNATYGVFDLPEGDHITRAVQANGGYEMGMLEAWRDQGLVTPDTLAIDVGACFGTHTVFLAQLGAFVVAFEPVQTEWLRQNVRLNGVEDRVRIFPLAAAERSRWFHAALDNVCNLGSTRLVPGKCGIQGVAVDSIVAKPSAPVSLVKIDAEGMELDVLRGMRQLLVRESPHVFVETESFPKVGKFMQACGYALVARYNVTPTYHYRKVA